jgi:hypothetical protein
MAPPGMAKPMTLPRCRPPSAPARPSEAASSCFRPAYISAGRSSSNATWHFGCNPERSCSAALNSRITRPWFPRSAPTRMLITSSAACPTPSEFKIWRDLARRTKNVSGFMYTPWQKKCTLLPAFGELLWSERWRGRRNVETVGLINHIYNLARYESRFRIGTATNRRLKNEDKNQKRSETNQPRKISR